MSQLHHTAVQLAEDGFWIFPCKPQSKIPAITGYLKAKWTPEQVSAWWDNHPDHNIGLCPELNDLVVVDVDSYKPECTFDETKIPVTMTSRTGRGGHHYFFDSPAGNRYPAKLEGEKAVDIKHRGLVVLPPSILPDGQYEWEGEEAPAPLPDWMPVKGKVDPSVDRTLADKAAALMDAKREFDGGRVLRVVQAADNTIEDRETWLAIGHALHFEYHGTPLENEARQAWIDWSLRWDGADNPEQLEAEAIKAWDATMPPGDILRQGIKPRTGGTIMYHLRPEKEKEEKILPPPTGIFRRYDAERKLQLRPWLIEDILREGEIGGISGGPGVGKTNMAAAWISGMLSGDGPAVGLPRIARPLNVAWVNAEEDVDSLDLRVFAAMQQLGLTSRGNLYTAGQEALISEDFDGTALVTVLNRESVINLDLVRAYISELVEQECDILLLDPVTEFNDGEENDRGDTKKLFRALKTMAQDAGLTVLYFAHTAQVPEGKRDDWYRGNLYAQRGSSAAVGALQFGATLTPMYPAGLSAQKAKEWREAQADAADDRVPNLVELVTIKSKMGTSKPKLIYEIVKSNMLHNGQHIPIAMPITPEMADRMMQQAQDGVADIGKIKMAVDLVTILGEGTHYSLSALHKQMRGVVHGWPDVEKLDLSKGAGQALAVQWMLPTMVSLKGVNYEIAMVHDKDAVEMRRRFAIVIERV